jgi:hypothetical protein
MDLNLKRFLAYYGKIILMPEILMSVYSCIDLRLSTILFAALLLAPRTKRVC